MDIGRDGYWKPHVINSSELSVPKMSKAVAAQKKNECINCLICHIKYFEMELPWMLYSLIPQSSIDVYPWSFEYDLVGRFHIHNLFQQRRYSHHKFASKNHWSMERYTQICNQ
jgi:hypothetical protein